MTGNPLVLLEEARKLDAADQPSAALMAYRRFLALCPNHAPARADYAGLLVVMQRYEDAREVGRKALDQDPNCVPALINLASAELQLGSSEAAETHFRRALQLDPNQTETRLGLGQCQAERGDLEAARSTFMEIVQLQPEHAQARLLLTQTLARLGGWKEVRKSWDEVITLTSHGDEALFERSHLHLLFGEMAEGWDLYESRFHIPGLIKPERHFPQPLWDGSPFPGKTLLLHWEQGFGDSLMFVRYAFLAKSLGGRVVLEVQPALAHLFTTCPGVDLVVPYGEPLPPFDLQLPLLSLPRVFQTRLDSIPAEIPYLQIPARVPHQEAIAEQLFSRKANLKAGLVWLGNAHYKRDFQRSIPPGLLAPFADLSQIAWFNLQLGVPDALPLPGMVDLAPSLGDFSDTAYALSGLDLLVTVDTAAAHLAGALGIPTLLLLPFFPDWRWMIEREDSPWYPSMKLYRQPAPNDWSSLLERLVQEFR